MSVIAWDGTTLAADKQAVFGGNLILATTKIFRVADALVGYAGGADFGEQMLAWLRDGAHPEEFPSSQRDREDWAGMLVIRHGSPILRYERTPYPIRFESKHIAIGSGRDFAMAAMYLGYSAVRAVEVASALDSCCGVGVDALTFEAVGEIRWTGNGPGQPYPNPRGGSC